MRVVALLLFTALTCMPAPGLADDGYKQLFQTVSGQISIDDQKAVYRSLDLTYDEKRSTFSSEKQGDSLVFEIEVMDLNHDGTPELFISGGSTGTTDAAGCSVWLFIRTNGKYHQNLGFPATSYTILEESVHHGFPDIQFGGQGFYDTIWRWNGHDYAYVQSVPIEAKEIEEKIRPMLKDHAVDGVPFDPTPE